MGSYFDLLDLADGASGEEAVAKVVAKVVVPLSSPNPPPPPPSKQKGSTQPTQQHAGFGRGRGQGSVGGRPNDLYQGGRGRGNGRGYYNGNGDGGYYNGNGDGGYYSGNGDHGYYNGDGDRGYYNRGYYNVDGDRGYYKNSGYDQVYHENNGQYRQDAYGGDYSYRYSERQAKENHYYNGDRYNRDGGQSRRRNSQYRPKEKPAADTASVLAEHKVEDKVVPAAETKQVEASSGNGGGVPASESEKSAGDAVKDDSKKEEGASDKKEGEGSSDKKEGEGDHEKKKKIRDPSVKLPTGSSKRKLKKQDPNVKESKKTTEEQGATVVEEKEAMTLEEYENMRSADNKPLDSSKSEGRKINAVAFEGLQLLEKKKVEDDARYKLANGQEDEDSQAKRKEVKPRKAISIQEYLQDYVPPRRGGFSSGNFRGGRSGGGGNGVFSGRSGDSSGEPRVYNNSGRGDEAIAFHNVEESRGNRAPAVRGDGYQQDRRDSYNGGRYQGRRDGYKNAGGYQQRGRGNGGQQDGGYNGGRGNGGGARGRGGEGGEAAPAPKADFASEFPALSGAAPAANTKSTPARS